MFYDIINNLAHLCIEELHLNKGVNINAFGGNI